MTIAMNHLLLIGGLAFITLLFRLGGYFGGAYLQRFPLIQRALEILPQLILTSLIARSLVDATPLLWVAALISLVIALIFRNVLVVMLAGVGFVLVATLLGAGV